MTDDGENILDYGAVENPDDPGIAEARANSKAIRAAAEAAGTGGTVYVPTGEFYYGDDSIANQLLFGNREPKGVSFVGDGPTVSKLAITEHLGEQNHWMFRYKDGYDHGTVTFEHLQIDGNGATLNLQPDYGRSGHGIVIEGNGTLDLQNVYVYDTYTAGVRNDGNWRLLIDRCTFERISIGSHQDTGGDTGGHAFANGQGSLSRDKSKITNCEFHKLARTVMDLADSGAEGTVRFENCWGRSLALAWIKAGQESLVEFRNVYAEPKTSYIDDLNDSNKSLAGRYFVQRHTGDQGEKLVIDVQDVEVVSTNRHGIFSYGGLESHTVLTEIRGSGLALRDMSRGDDSNYDAAFDDDTDSELTFDNFGELSVHNTGGAVFECPNGTGEITTLHRDGNTSGLGDSGNISIGTDDANGDGLSPAVPSRGDVGFESNRDLSPSVSWVRPADGDTVSGTVTVQVAASDAEDDDTSLSVEYRVDDGSWRATSYNPDTGYYEDTWDSTVAADGDHSMTARATDSADNAARAAIDIAVDNETTLYDDWTPTWAGRRDDWNVVAGNEFTGGYALTFDHDGDKRTRYAISCDKVGQPGDAETLDRARIPDIQEEQNGAAHARVYLRSGMGSDGEDGYMLDIDHSDDKDPQTTFRVAKYTDGYFQPLRRFGSPEEGRFYYRRFRVEGTELKAKVWPANESEPADWDVKLSDTDHSEGWVGLGSFDPQPVETDVFSVATGGESAPFVRTDSSPSVSWVRPADGDTVSGTVTVQVAASDAEDDDTSLSVEYRVDDGSWRATSYNPDTGYYEDTWDSTVAADGDHSMTARATDSADNADAASVSVATDNATTPTVSALSLSEIETENSDAEFDADWQVSDGDGDLSSVDLTLVQESDGATEDSVTVSVGGEDASDTTRLVAANDNGSGDGYVVELAVTDNEGNTASGRASATETETQTGVAPSINRFSVSEAGRSDPHADVTAVWTVSDADGDLESVAIEVVDGNGTTQGVTWTLNGSTASDTDSFRVENGGGKDFDVTVTVTDESGRSASETESVTA